MPTKKAATKKKAKAAPAPKPDAKTGKPDHVE